MDSSGRRNDSASERDESQPNLGPNQEIHGEYVITHVAGEVIIRPLPGASSSSGPPSIPDPYASLYKSTSSSRIERLKKRKFDGRDLPATAGDCVICLETLSSAKTVTQMPCNHLIHNECIRGWLKNHKTCPTCRRRV